MKTTVYNPSELEVKFAHALEKFKETLEKEIPGNKIVDITSNSTEENPTVRFQLVDKDGDLHELVLKVIQLPDK